MKKIILAALLLTCLVARAEKAAITYDPATGTVTTPDTPYAFPSGSIRLGPLDFGAPGALEVSGGAITITGGSASIGGEGDTDDELDTVSGLSDGMAAVVFAESAAQNITFKHGTGNLLLPGGTDFIMDDYELVMLQGVGSNVQVLRGVGAGGITQFVGLSDTPANYTGAELKLLRVNATPDAVEFVAQNALKLDDFAAADDNTDLDASTGAHGLLPKLDGNSSHFLDGTGAWAVPPGGGDVVGPAGATDNAIPRFDGATGQLLQDSLATISDTGSLDIPAGETYSIDGTPLAAADVGAAASTTQIIAGIGLAGGGTLSTDRTLSLSHLGIQSLSDPGADRIVFWDDGAGASAWLVIGSGLEISGTTLQLGALTGAWDAGSYEIRAETFESDVATGTAPFTIASTTVVTNLNADLLDGVSAADLVADADFDAQTILAAVSDNTPAAVTIAENDILGRLPSGNIAGITASDLTEEETPAAGDFLLGWESGGALRKFDVGNLVAGGGALLANGTVELSADWDAGGYGVTASNLTAAGASGVSSGTAGIPVGALTYDTAYDDTGTYLSACYHVTTDGDAYEFVICAMDDGGLYSYSIDGSGDLTFADSDDQGGNYKTVASNWDGQVFVCVADSGLYSYTVNSSGVLAFVDSDDQGGSYIQCLVYETAESDRVVVAAGALGIVSYSYDGSGNLTYLDADYQSGGSYTGVTKVSSYYIACDGNAVLSYTMDGSGNWTYVSSNIDYACTSVRAVADPAATNHFFVGTDGTSLVSYELNTGTGAMTVVDAVACTAYSVGAITGLPTASAVAVIRDTDGIRTYHIDSSGRLYFASEDDQGGGYYGCGYISSNTEAIAVGCAGAGLRMYDIDYTGAAAIPGKIVLQSSGNSALTTTITTAEQTNNVAYVMPAADGNSGDVLSTDGTGNTSWQPGISPLTTAGDIYTYDSANARLPVGTDGQILTADSGETTGLKWESKQLFENTQVDLTSGMTSAQIQALCDAQPKNLGGYTLTFQFGDGTYTLDTALNFTGFYNGYVIIQGNTGDTVPYNPGTTDPAVVLNFSGANVEGILIGESWARQMIRFMEIRVDSSTSYRHCIYNQRSSGSTAVQRVVMKGNSATYGYGYYGQYCLAASVWQCWVSNIWVGLFNAEGGPLKSDTNTQFGTQPAYGLRCISGDIKKNGTQPTGSTANESATEGGVIE